LVAANGCLLSNDNSPELETQSCDFYNNKIGETKRSYNVLDRTEYSLIGYGYRCSITEITFLTETSFFNSKQDYPPRRIDIVVSADQCNSMIYYKLCNNNAMNCNDKDCIFNEDPKPTFKWWDQVSTIIRHCYTQKVKLSSTKSQLAIIENADTTCLAHELYCRAGKFTYVWTNEIIIKCPFRIVNQYVFTKIGNLLISETLMFQLIKTEIACKNISVSSTTEGLWIGNVNETYH